MINKIFNGGKVLLLAVSLFAVPASAGFGSVSSNADRFPGLRTLFPAYGASTAASLKGPVIRTEKVNYLAAEAVKITGYGFEGYERVRFAVGTESKTRTSAFVVSEWDAYASSRGSVSTSWIVPDSGTSYTITATGTVSGYTAKTTISTDSLAGVGVNMDQCANGTDGLSACTGSQWQNGNLNSNNSNYVEGDVVPFRMHFTGLTSGQVYVAKISWDTTQQGKHAYDFIASWNVTETGDPCNGKFCAGNPANTFTVTNLDGNIQGGGAQPQTYIANPYSEGATDFLADTTKREMRGWGVSNVSVSNPSIISPAAGTNADYVGTTTTSIDITFTATGAEALFSWGGHIARRPAWGFDYGAADINGSPYHMRYEGIFQNGASVGNGGSRDMQLQGNAIVFPSSVTIIKHATPPSSFSFPFTTNLPGGNFNLVDDNSVTDPSYTVNNILDFGIAYTVTEGNSAPYTLTGVTCSPVVSSDSAVGSVSISGATVTFNLTEADAVTCTYNNDFTTAAEAEVSGRVTDIYGSPIAYAWVSGTDANGNTKSAMTNQFGYYNIRGLEAGTSLFFDVAHKSFTFGSQFVTLEEEVTTVNFTGTRR